MRPHLSYFATGLGVIAVITLGLWPFLEAADRRGVIVAGLIALPVQAIAFSLLMHVRGRANGFLAVWAGGTLVRMAVVLGAAAVAIQTDAPGAVAMLLALAGFLFGLLLIEPVWFRAGPTETT